MKTETHSAEMPTRPTTRVGREAKTSKRRTRRLEREVRAVEFRKAGLTYEAIAERISDIENAEAIERGEDPAKPIRASTAYKCVRRWFQRTERKTAETIEDVRQLELERLNTMLTGLWTRARDGDAAAIDRVIKIQQRRAELLGLDAPKPKQQFEHTGKDGGPIETTLDFSGLTDDERAELRRLANKGSGKPGT